jgi:hypothetical protein
MVDTLRDMLDLLTTRNWMHVKEGKTDVAEKSLAAQVVQQVIAARALVIVRISMFTNRSRRCAYFSQAVKVKTTARRQIASSNMDLVRTQISFLQEAPPAILHVRNPARSRTAAKASTRVTCLDRLRSHTTMGHTSTPTMC